MPKGNRLRAVPANKVSGVKDWFVLSQVTKLYHNDGPLRIVATRSAPSGVAEVRVTISGYFEPDSNLAGK